MTHSLYILDPDGNEIELYVDVESADWRLGSGALQRADQAPPPVAASPRARARPARATRPKSGPRR